MKKFITVLILTLCLLLFGTFLASAESYDKFTYEVSENEEIIITGCDESVTEVTIPDVVDGKKVTAIGEFAFCDCAKLTKVEMGENIIEIGEGAFAGCSKLSTVDFADSVEIIGASAFRGCSVLENVTLPLNLRIISDQAFYSCSKMTEIEFPSGLEKIEADAFYDCYNLTTINIPASVTSISDGAFSACMGLVNITVDSGNENYICDEYGALYNIDKTILLQYPVANTRTNFVIPDSLEEIGSYAFCGAEHLTGQLILPQKVTFIPKYAFFACVKLQKIILPDGITGIDEYAFFSCQNISEMSIPEKTEYIGDRAFASCVKLTALSFPDKMYFIGVEAFSRCTLLNSVTMPESMKTIGAKAFYNCASLEEFIIPDGIKIVDEELLYGCTNLKRVIIPETAVFIADSAFCNCGLLTEIVLNDNITHIGDYAFKGCDKLESVYYTGTETKWKSIKIGSGNSKLSSVIYNSVIAEDISLDKTSAKISVANSLELNVIFNPLNATNKDVIWSSSNEDVATVQNGIVTALSKGEALITATTSDGNYSATCLIIVSDENIDKPIVTSISAVYEMPYTYEDENGIEKTVPSGVAFAKVYDQYGNYKLKEYGMLLTDKNLEKEEFTLSKQGVLKGKGETKQNTKGQFGIMFYGNGMQYGKTYYTLSYAIYEDNNGNEITIYGDEITSFSPKGE